MSDPVAPPKSPDGQWWWDGAAWQPIATLPASAPVWAPPPEEPAVVAAPVLVAAPAAATAPAAAAPAAGEEWPSWLPRTSAAEKVVANVETRVDPGAAPVKSAVSSVPVAIPGEARSSTWAQGQYTASQPPGANRPRMVLMAGIGILALVAAVVTFKLLSTPGLFSLSSNSGGGVPTGTAGLGPAGTQYEQATRFMNNSLNPALNEATQTMGPLATNCNGADSTTCRDSILATDVALKKAIAVIDKGPVPDCIKTPIKQTRADLHTTESDLAMALRGYQNNDHTLITNGLNAFSRSGSALVTDGHALDSAVCSKFV